MTLRLAERDEAGAQALSELRDRGLDLVADTLAHAVDDVLGFFTTLRNEVGCYLTCLNLQQRLADLGEPVCLPEPAPPDARAFSARGLYDPVLSLRTGRRAVGNDIDADDTPLVVVTGANSGGKSTFLRSVGIAQLLMQAGMAVPAESLRASPADGVFTHYRREEDAAMDRGKLDEELARMRDITDHVRPGSLVLCNESFASTNEWEGSQIARGVLAALTEAGVRVVIVTHLHDLARDLHEQHPPGVLFLRAERRPDGARTYRLVPREPLPTSFAQDLYQQIFGRPVQAAGSDASAVRHDSPSPSVA